MAHPDHYHRDHGLVEAKLTALVLSSERSFAPPSPELINPDHFRGGIRMHIKVPEPIIPSKEPREDSEPPLNEQQIQTKLFNDVSDKLEVNSRRERALILLFFVTALFAWLNLLPQILTAILMSIAMAGTVFCWRRERRLTREKYAKLGKGGT